MPIISSLKKRMYEYVSEGRGTPYMYYNLLEGAMYGIIHMEAFYIQIHCEADKQLVILSNIKTKEMEIITEKGIEDQSAVLLNQVLDLRREGDRWEGPTLHSSPFGYGCLYDGENRIVYEGFMYNEKRVCYGINYYNHVETVHYQGGLYDNGRWGIGRMYDLQGVVEFEGIWLDNHKMNSCNPIQPYIVHSQMKNIRLQKMVPEIENQIKSCTLSQFFDQVKQIIIGNNCLQHRISFCIDQLMLLETIKIGNDSMNSCLTDQPGGCCQIRNCPNLKRISIGNYSFWNTMILELANLPSLISLKLGSGCFYHSPSFSLIGK